jgi:hypothetical protein
VADRLYALPPAEFTAARDDAAKAAKAAGDRAGATAIGKLRRPTVAAWLVNLLALRRPERLDELFDLGSALRQAQQGLRGPELRELAARRRTVVAALVREASDLAVAAGASRSALPATEVETTLAAALADEDLAHLVRAGRLLKSGQYDGFGEARRPQLQVVDGGRSTSSGSTAARSPHAPATQSKRSAGPKRAASEPATGPQRSAATQLRHPARAPQSDVVSAVSRARLDQAAAALAEAEAAYAASVAMAADWTRTVAHIEEQLTRLRADRLAAHSALLAAHAAIDAADATLQQVRRRLAAAERAAKRGL